MKKWGCVVYRGRRFTFQLEGEKVVKSVTLKELSAQSVILYAWDLKKLTAELCDLWRGRVTFVVMRQATTSKVFSLKVDRLELRSLDLCVAAEDAELKKAGYQLDDPQSLESLRERFHVRSRSISSTAFSAFISTLKHPRYVLSEYESDRTALEYAAQASLSGGALWLDPAFKDRWIRGGGEVLDINSCYPYVMQSHAWPDRHKAREVSFEADISASSFAIVEVVIYSLRLRVGRFHTFPLTDWQPGERVFLTSLDWQWVKWSYSLEYFFVRAIVFEAGHFDLFKPFVRLFQQQKEQAKDPIERQQAKRTLDLLFGRLIGRAGSLESVPRPWQKGQRIQAWTVEPKAREQEQLSNTFLATFVLARARALLYGFRFALEKARQEDPEVASCIYMDTDSIHLLGDERSLKKAEALLPLDPVCFGFFKVDHRFEQARYFHERFYYHYSSKQRGKYTTKLVCAGLPKQAQEKIAAKNFLPSGRFLKKLSQTPFYLAKRVPGGYTQELSSWQVSSSELQEMIKRTDWVR